MRCKTRLRTNSVYADQSSYLVLEYVDGGELFEYIYQRGRLDEAEAVKYFRQILSAVGYCHSFKICHRDLKPENILLTKAGSIRVADFGMAALHQGIDHKLTTSCGSPHYAAPELISGNGYHGEKVDTWSLGVILFVSLAGRLPFDVDQLGDNWLRTLLHIVKKGIYVMDDAFSTEAKSLIWRMLQVNPRDRITIAQIWKHPLLRKYDYMDDHSSTYQLQALDFKLGRLVSSRSEIDTDLLRQLRSMWHLLSEEHLVKCITSEG